MTQYGLDTDDLYDNPVWDDPELTKLKERAQRAAPFVSRLDDVFEREEIDRGVVRDIISDADYKESLAREARVVAERESAKAAQLERDAAAARAEARMKEEKARYDSLTSQLAEGERRLGESHRVLILAQGEYAKNQQAMETIKREIASLRAQLFPAPAPTPVPVPVSTAVPAPVPAAVPVPTPVPVPAPVPVPMPVPTSVPLAQGPPLPPMPTYSEAREVQPPSGASRVDPVATKEADDRASAVYASMIESAVPKDKLERLLFGTYNQAVEGGADTNTHVQMAPADEHKFAEYLKGVEASTACRV